MSKTRKDLIISKYQEFQDILKTKFNLSGLFPSLEDIDLVDMLYFFNLKFTSDDIETRKATIKEISEMCKIEIPDDKFDEAFECINEYIDFMKKVQN